MLQNHSTSHSTARRGARAAAAALLSLTVVGAGSSAVQAAPSAQTQAQSAGKAAGYAPEKVIRFKPGRYIHNQKTARKYLPGTSRKFQNWAARTGATWHQTSCDGFRGAITITSYIPRGYVLGGVSPGCVTDPALWVKIASRWVLVDRHDDQDAWFDCSVLRTYRVPSPLLAAKPAQRKCFNAQGKPVRYRG